MMAMPLLLYRIYILSVHVKRPNSLDATMYAHNVRLCSLPLSYIHITHTHRHLCINTRLTSCQYGHSYTCTCLPVCVCVHAMMLMILFLLVEIHTCCRIHSHPHNEIHYSNQKNDQKNATHRVRASKTKERTNNYAKKKKKKRIVVYSLCWAFENVIWCVFEAKHNENFE